MLPTVTVDLRVCTRSCFACSCVVLTESCLLGVRLSGALIVKLIECEDVTLPV
jgi:hypothetical protein